VQVQPGISETRMTRPSASSRAVTNRRPCGGYVEGRSGMMPFCAYPVSTVPRLVNANVVDEVKKVPDVQTELMPPRANTRPFDKGTAIRVWYLMQPYSVFGKSGRRA